MLKTWVVIIVALLALNASAQDSLNVTRIGDINYWGYAQSVTVGDYVYVATSASGLVIVDISDPAAPVEAGRCELPGIAVDVAVSGNFAYVADYSGGLWVIDVSNPANPLPTGNYPGWITKVSVWGNYAYVMADQGMNIWTLDVSDPAEPVLSDSMNFSSPQQIWDLAATEGYLCAVTYNGNNFYVIEADTQGQLEMLADCILSAHGDNLIIDGSAAYVGTTDGLSIVSLANPRQPSQIGFCSTGEWSWVNSVAVADNHAYVSLDDSSMKAIDVSNPAFPTIVGSCALPGEAHGLGVSGNYAVAAAGVLALVDISNPVNPVPAGDCGDPAQISGLAISGDHAYLADFWKGLRIIDFSSPQAPVQVGSYTPLEGYVCDVVVSGSYAYLAAEPYLRILDISTPQTPLEVSNINMGDAFWVEVSGNYAYVSTAMGQGLAVVDISNPTAPEEIGSIAPGGWPASVAFQGNYAYIPEVLGYFHIWDITDPTNPVQLGGCALTSPNGIAVAGNYAFVADSAGLEVIDVGNPDAPAVAATYALPGKAQHLTLLDNHLYMADRSGGLRIYDASDPLSLHLAGYYADGMITDVAAVGPYAYGSSDFSFNLYDCSQALSVGPWEVRESLPASFALRGSSPNPFNSFTTISYDLPSAGFMSLKVYDTAGRIITALVDGRQEAGRHAVVFDGAKLASGIYFVRMQAGNYRSVQKLILLK